MGAHKDQVRRFHEVVWNQHDKRAIPSVLDEQLTFRGSLGHARHGHEGFADYLDLVHSALEEYRCDVRELVAEGDKVFARMTFSGIHRATFMGHPPTGRRVAWDGCARFTFDRGRIVDLWVLGDLHALERQLRGDLPQGRSRRRPLRAGSTSIPALAESRCTHSHRYRESGKHPRHPVVM
jgi:steroid delta-isomerase-like uncharacterized protein